MAEMTDPKIVSADRFAYVRDAYIQPKGVWATSRVQRVMDAARLSRSDLVLDLACSMGTFSNQARQVGARPVGLDLNYDTIVEGRTISDSITGHTTPRVQANALSLPFADDTFDVIINADFVEHTPSEAKLPIFIEMQRVLKKGGRAVVYSPNLNKIRWGLFGEKAKRLLRLRSQPVPRWQEFVDPDHFGLTTPWKVERHLRRAGFQTSIRYYDFHVPVLSKIPGANLLLRPLISAQFMDRFLVVADK